MVTVAALHHQDIPAARALLTAALDDDPGWVQVLPDRLRSVVLSTVLGVALRDAQPTGFVLAAHDGDTLAGVALWRPPGDYSMSRRRQLRARRR